jgi:hypothetical protein
MSNIIIIGAAAVAALIVYTYIEEKKKTDPGSGHNPNDSPPTVTPINPGGNGGLVPSGCVATGTPGYFACKDLVYKGTTGNYISTYAVLPEDIGAPQILIGNDGYYFRQTM